MIPLFLIIGTTGSGKSLTTAETIEEKIFKGSIIVEEDYTEQVESLNSSMFYLELEHPELAKNIKKFIVSFESYKTFTWRKSCPNNQKVRNH